MKRLLAASVLCVATVAVSLVGPASAAGPTPPAKVVDASAGVEKVHRRGHRWGGFHLSIGPFWHGSPFYYSRPYYDHYPYYYSYHRPRYYYRHHHYKPRRLYRHRHHHHHYHRHHRHYW